MHSNNKIEPESKRILKYGLRKLTIGVVSCLTGISTMASAIMPMYAAEQTANNNSKEDTTEESNGGWTELKTTLKGDIAEADFPKSNPELSNYIAWMDWADPEATVTGIGAYGIISVGATWEKEVLDGVTIKATVTALKPWESTEIYGERVKGTSVEWTYRPDLENYTYNGGYEGNDVMTPTGSAEVKVLSRDVWSHYLFDNKFEDEDLFATDRIGVTAYHTSIGVTLDLEMIIDGVSYPVDIVLGDGEQLTETEFVTYTTEGDPWRLFTEANGSDAVGGTTDENGVYSVPLTNRWYPVTASQLQGKNSKYDFQGDNVIGFVSEYGYENAGLGTQVLGPYSTYDLIQAYNGEGTEVKTNPLFESTNTNSVSLYFRGSGCQTTIIGFVLSDKGDAPSSYGLAQHMLLTRASQHDANGVYADNQQPYLGTVKADYDKPAENAITGYGLDAKDTTSDSNPWKYDDENVMVSGGSADEGEAQLSAEDDGRYTYFDDAKHQNTLKIKACANGSETAYVRGWIDWNEDGVFTDDEASDVVEVTGTDESDITLHFTNEHNYTTTATKLGARVRISTVKDDILQPTGVATNGEVEDFQVPLIVSPVGDKEETTDKQGVTQTATLEPTAYGTLKEDAGVEQTETNYIDPDVAAYIVDPDTGANLGTTLTIDGEGTYTIEQDGASIKVTFVPEFDFTGDGTGIIVRSTDGNGNTTGWDNDPEDNIAAATATMDSYYQPHVTPIAPTGEDSTTSGLKGESQSSRIRFDREDSDDTTLNLFEDEDQTSDLDYDTLTLLDADGNPADTVVTEDGTYTLKDDIITFTPNPDFVGTATPVKVQIKNKLGNPVTVTYTPVVEDVYDVTVNYVDEDGNTIQASETVMSDEPADTEYDVTDKKADTITADDGTVYYFKEVSTDEGNSDPSGTIADADVNVTYVYEKAGSAEVSYVDTDGNTIKEPTVLAEDVKAGTAYDATTAKPETITNEGTVYYLKETAADSAAETGEVASGETAEVTYVYEKAGSVVVKYVDEEGNEIAVPAEIATDAKPGSDYDTTAAKPKTITTEDGKTYELVEEKTEGNETGAVESGATTEVTYVYKEVKSSVTVNYVDEDGNAIADPVTDEDTVSTGTEYDTTDNKPETITADDGTVYYVKELAEDSAPETGTTTDKDTNVTYVYEKAGSVKVNFVDENGDPIADPVTEEDNVKAGTEYDTTETAPNTIVTEDGKTYVLDETPTSDDETGTVEAGKTTEVTYTYHEVKGNVVVDYVDLDGNPIKAAQTYSADGESTGTEFDTTTETLKPQTIVTEDGKTYKLVRVEGDETGTITTDTQTVTYVYQEVKADIDVAFVDEDGNKIADTVKDTDEASTGTAYDTSDQKKDKIITSDGTVYYYKETDSKGASETGTVTAEDQTVTYVYEKAGDVTVSYVDEEGNELLTSNDLAADAKPGSEYDATTVKPDSIISDGTVYYLKEVAADSADEKGTVPSGETAEVTYVYEKAGSVVVKYTDEDGNEIAVPAELVTDAKSGTEYDSTAAKPETIVTEDGKTYVLVPEKTEGDETGAVESGKTTEVTYVYKEVKSSVTVNYVDEDGNAIADPVTDEDTVSTGTEYDTTDNKPESITTDDGTVYYVKELAEGSAPETGTTTTDDAAVTYVYEKAGSVVAKFVDENGNEIADPETIEENAKPGTAYDTSTAPEAVIVKDGKTYVLDETPTTDPETGEVVSGETTEVTYTYHEVKGNVVVVYEDINGNVIQAPATVAGEDGQSTGTDFNTATDELKPQTIVTEDGKTYELVKVDGDESGTITTDTQVVKYIYKEVTADVDVEFVDTEGNKIADTVKDTDEASTGTAYDTTDQKKDKIVTNDGTVYYFKEVGAESAPETGTVTADDQTVTYVYEKAGDVTVSYVDEEGNELLASNELATDAKAGSEYDATTVKPESITSDGTVYYLKEVAADSADEKGTVPSGETAEVTYVYEKAGSVTVKYVDEDGNEIQVPAELATDAKPGTEYDSTTAKPETIVTEDGKTYVLVPEKTEGDETGAVESGKTTEVTYVYKEVKSSVTVNYVDEDGNKIADPVTDEDTVSTGTEYDTTDNKPESITTDDGTVYYVKELAEGSAPETGTTTTDDAAVTYVYEKAGSVVAKFVDENGNEIADPVTVEENAKPGAAYDTSSTPETVIVKDGKTYVLDETPTTDPETGEVASGETTEVTYTYHEVKGNVVVVYEDINGNVIKAPVGAFGEEGTSTGDPYDTATDALKPQTIVTEDGKTYELVKVDGDETGTISTDPAIVKYIYKEVTADIDVEFVDTEGNKIADTVKDTDEASTGTAYDTTDQKKDKIVTNDGTVYYFKEVGAESAPETGTVTADDQTVTYVYEKAGDVTVSYVDEEGNELLASNELATDAKAGSEYDATTVKPESITSDGTVYYLKEVAADSADEKGTVPSGETAEVTYVYEKAGSVTVKYVDEDGNEIQVPAELATDAKPGTEYDSTTAKPETIVTEDGKTYVLVPEKTEGDETGTVESGKDTVVKYVYKEVKADVVVKYTDTDGNEIAAPVTDEDDISTGAAYDTTDNKPETITTDDGTVYYVKELAEGSAPETGTTTTEDTTVTYVYEKAGSVVAKFVDENGNEIADPVTVEENAKPGAAYDTSSTPETVIVKDGKTYVLDETPTTDPETGEVASGETTEVTYTYHEVKGNVVVVYEDINGNVIKAPAEAFGEEGTSTGDPYDTATDALKPQTIVTEDGKTYELVKVDGDETGIISTDPAVVKYIYKEVTADVNVEFVDTEGNKIADTVKDTDDASTGTAYDTTDQKKDKIITSDGTVYYVKEVKADGAAETGTVTAEDQTVTYVYEKAGSVIVKYVDDDGNEIQAPAAAVQDEKPGTAYDTATETLQPQTIMKDGKKYILVSTEGEPSGSVTSGAITVVTYVYQEVIPDKGTVQTVYVDTEGNPVTASVMSDSMDAGSPYATSPAVIEGYTLKEVPANASGTITEGCTTVTYVYEKIPDPQGDVMINYVDKDGNPVALSDVTDLQNAGTDYTTSAKEIDGYVLVETPENANGMISTGTTVVTYVYQPLAKFVPDLAILSDIGYIPSENGDAAVIPYVEGYTASVNGTPLELVDPSDPSKGYKAPAYLKDMFEDTPIHYEKTPAAKSSVVVKFVDEEGNEIAESITQDPADVGSTYGTSPAVIDGYVLSAVPENATGELTEDVTTVTYVYRKAEGTPAVVLVEYVDENGNPIANPDLDTEKAEGDVYSTKPKDIKGYILSEVPENAEGTAQGVTKVKYVYKAKGKFVPNMEGLEPVGYDADSTAIPYVEGYTAKDKDGNPLELIDPNDPSKGYKAPAYMNPDDLTVDTPIDYVKDEPKTVTITVRYVDAEGNDLADAMSMEKTDGEDYITAPKSIDNYKLTEMPENAAGTAAEGTEVIYVYAPIATGNVLVNYVDEEGNPIDAADMNKGLAAGTDYTTAPKEIEGYKLVKVPEDANGTVKAGDTVVTYVYEKLPVTKWVDEDGNELKEPVYDSKPDNDMMSDVEGYYVISSDIDEKGNVINVYKKAASYKTNLASVGDIPYDTTTGDVIRADSIPYVEGYTACDENDQPLEFIDPGDPTKGYKAPKVDDALLGTDTIINYKSTLVVKFVDKEGNEIAAEEVDKSMNAGSAYTTKPAIIAGYTLVAVPDNANGTLDDGTITVTYVYEKSGTKGTVVASYVDADGNVLADPDIQTNLTIGDQYATAAKEIPGYTLIAEPVNARGEVADGTTEVKYVYKKNAITSWVDESGNKLKEDEEGNKPDNDGKSDISGYELKETKTDKDGNTINVYKKVSTATNTSTTNTAVKSTSTKTAAATSAAGFGTALIAALAAALKLRKRKQK